MYTCFFCGFRLTTDGICKYQGCPSNRLAGISHLKGFSYVC